MTSNRYSAFAASFMLCLCMFAFSARSAVVPDTTYPQFRLTPQSPAPQDSVSLWFVKGTSQSCYPVGYFTSFTISDDRIECIMAPCPSRYTIKILYRQLLVGLVCLPPLPPPTEYGPHFAFGELAPGYYIIEDSTNGNKSLFSFSVGENTFVSSPVSFSRSGQTIYNITYSSGLLRFTLDRPQRLSISAYTVNGREISGIPRSGFFQAGINGIPIKSGILAGGIIFVRIKGAEISEITRIKID